MAAENKSEGRLFMFSSNPERAVDEILENLQEVGNTSGTFELFIANLLKTVLIGNTKATDGSHNKGLLLPTQSLTQHTQQINAVSIELIGIMIGHLGQTTCRDGERKAILTKEMKAPRFFTATPVSPTAMIIKDWDEKIAYMLGRLDKYVARAFCATPDGCTDEVKYVIQQNLADLTKYYTDREGRIAMQKCMKLLAASSNGMNLTRFVQNKSDKSFLEKFKADVVKQPMGRMREDYFIGRMTTEIHHMTALLDNLLTGEEDYEFWMCLLQNTCQRNILPGVFLDFYYGFLPHELVYLASYGFAFQARGIIHIIKCITLLRGELDYVRAGQPMIEI